MIIKVPSLPLCVLEREYDESQNPVRGLGPFNSDRAPSTVRPYTSLLTSTSTMATTLPRQKGRDRAILALDALIQVLEVAKVACVFPPAQVAIGSTSALLTIIKVRPLPLFHYTFPIRVPPGLRGQ